MRRNKIWFVLSLASALGLLLARPAFAEDPIVKLVSSENGKCLQPLNGSSVQGVAIVQEACNGSTAQQWTVTSVSSTKVHLVNMASHMCLDARGGPVNGTPIQQWTCNKISNENWGFGITNNLLASAVSNSWSHCIATPGDQNHLPMSLRACSTTTSSQLWTRPPG